MVKDKEAHNSLTLPNIKKMLKPELCPVEVWVSSIATINITKHLGGWKMFCELSALYSLPAQVPK